MFLQDGKLNKLYKLKPRQVFKMFIVFWFGFYALDLFLRDN